LATEPITADGRAGALLALALLLAVIGGASAWARSLEPSAVALSLCSSNGSNPAACLEREARASASPWLLGSLGAAIAAGAGLTAADPNRRRRRFTGLTTGTGAAAMGTALGLWTVAPPLHAAYVSAAAGGWLVLVAGAASSIARGDALKAVVLTLLLGGPASIAAGLLGSVTPW
jgi:hypothetical protein